MLFNFKYIRRLTSSLNVNESQTQKISNIFVFREKEKFFSDKKNQKHTNNTTLVLNYHLKDRPSLRRKISSKFPVDVQSFSCFPFAKNQESKVGLAFAPENSTTTQND